MMLKKTGKLILLYLILLFPSFANTVVQASLTSGEIYQGQTVQLRFATNSKLLNPNEVEFAGINTRYTSSDRSSMTRIVNGVRSSSYSYTHNFILSPKGAGRYILGPFEVATEEGKVTVNVGILNVVKPEENEDFIFKITSSKTQYYIGEPIFLEISFEAKKSFSNLALSIPSIAGNFMPLVEEVADNVVIGINNYRVAFERTANGKYYTKIVYIPERAVDLNLSNSIAQLRGLAGTRKTRDFFGREIDSEVYENLVIIAQSKDLQINNLPELDKGKFSGIVGYDFSIEANLPVEKAFVGDPLLLNLQIKGIYDTKKLNRDAIDFSQIEKDFAIEYQTSNVESSVENSHSYLIRPLNSKIKNLNPISLIVFDTKTGKYREIQTKRLKLDIAETKIISVDDVFKNEIRESEEEAILEAKASDKLELFTAEEIKNHKRKIILLDFLAIFIIILATVVILAALLIVFLKYKKENIKENPIRDFKKLISKADSSEESLKEVLNFIRINPEIKAHFNEELLKLQELLFSSDKAIESKEIILEIKKKLRGIK